MGQTRTIIHTVKLRPDRFQEGMWFVEVPETGYRGQIVYPDPPRYLKQICEAMLINGGYKFAYKSKIGDWEVWCRYE